MQQISKIVGIVQGLLGAGGAAIPDVASALGTGMGASVFNLASGAVLSYLGFKTDPTQQKTGLQVVGGANALAGLLGAGGLLQGLGFDSGGASSWIHLAVGAVTFVSSFLSRNKAA